ncbi:MAG: tetratricopeptide repeat protein [Blastocatellia bacterium]|nr:tetratricopeptide repeat protein [Blastocatellia bacterium]
MATEIRYALGLLMLFLTLGAPAAAQSAPDKTDHQVIITMPTDTRLPPGDHRADIYLAGKKITALVKVADPAGSPAPGGTSPGAAPGDSGAQPSPESSLAPERGAARPAEPSPWLPVGLAVVGTAILIGAGAWLYFKVYLPRKQIEPYREALRLVQAERFEEALPLLTQVESKLPDRLRRDARFFIAFAHFKLKNSKEAEHVLDGLHRENLKDAQVAYLLAYLRVEDGHYDDAEPILLAMEKNERLGLYHAKKLLGIVEFRRALAALKEGHVDGAAALFEKVERLGDFAAHIPPGLRDRHIALGTKALFDKDVAEAQRRFTSLEQAVEKEPEAQRAAKLAIAKLGLALTAWIEDAQESDEKVERLLVEAAQLLDADGPLDLPWPEAKKDEDLAAQISELDAKADKTADEKQRERCLRDLHFLRGATLLRAWRRLEPAAAHDEVQQRYEEALSRFACSRARDEQFSDVFLVVGLLTYYFHKPGPERGRGVDLLEQAQKRGAREPDAMEIINNRARIERANADAVDLYLQVLDKYLHDDTVRAEVRFSLLNRLNRYRRIQGWDKRPDLASARRIEPTVAEMRDRSELLLVRVEEIISSQSSTEESHKIRQLSDVIKQDGQHLCEQAADLERNESELLALTGNHLFEDR